MKRIFFACFVCVFSFPFAFSQDVEDHFNCANFTKKIEYNLMMSGNIPNIKSKSAIEKLFFGDFNAPIEFCYEPSSEINPCEQLAKLNGDFILRNFYLVGTLQAVFGLS